MGVPRCVDPYPSSVEKFCENVSFINLEFSFKVTQFSMDYYYLFQLNDYSPFEDYCSKNRSIKHIRLTAIFSDVGSAKVPLPCQTHWSFNRNSLTHWYVMGLSENLITILNRKSGT